MKCKKCKRPIEDNSVFCNWCGARQVKEQRSVKVPEPRQLPSGNWTIQLRAEKISVTEPTAEKCRAKAAALRSGFVEKAKNAPRMTVAACVDKFIANNSNVLSPSTIRCYKGYRKQRFKSVMDKDISSVDWQKAINDECAKDLSPKTISNSWRLITAAMRAEGLSVPSVHLPKLVKNERPWLDFEQIQKFLLQLKGNKYEVPALLALHSLRRSELLDLHMSDIDLEKNIIHVSGAMVRGENGFVHKDQNKNRSSQRDIPIMIPRLKELLQQLPEDTDRIVTSQPNKLYDRFNTVCRQAGVPEVGVHGLRHSAISLGYHLGWSIMTTMQVGGYSETKTVMDIYTHLAQQDKNEDIKKMEDFYKQIC